MSVHGNLFTGLRKTLFLRSKVTTQSVLEPPTPQQKRVVARAIASLSEERTMQWVRDMNYEVGEESEI